MVVRAKVKYKCRKIRQQNQQKKTSGEMAFEKFLKHNGIKYAFQFPIYTRSSFILVDFVLPEWDLAIEIDGTSHKGRLKSWQSYNKWRERIIAKRGLALFRFWNEDILNNSDNFRKFKGEILHVV